MTAQAKNTSARGPHPQRSGQRPVDVATQQARKLLLRGLLTSDELEYSLGQFRSVGHPQQDFCDFLVQQMLITHDVASQVRSSLNAPEAPTNPPTGHSSSIRRPSSAHHLRPTPLDSGRIRPSGAHPRPDFSAQQQPPSGAHPALPRPPLSPQSSRFPAIGGNSPIAGVPRSISQPSDGHLKIIEVSSGDSFEAPSSLIQQMRPTPSGMNLPAVTPIPSGPVPALDSNSSPRRGSDKFLKPKVRTVPLGDIYPFDKKNESSNEQVKDHSAHGSSSGAAIAGSSPLIETTVQLYTRALTHCPLFAPHFDKSFDKQNVLHEGQLGQTYRTYDKRLEREVAVKRLNAEHSDERSRKRFLREMRLMAKLDHPAIPSVYEAGLSAKGENYFVTRLVTGQTLTDFLKTRENPEQRQRFALESLMKVAEAIVFAHTRSIIHRDLNPDNIILGEHGEVTVLGWSMARDREELEEETWPSAHAFRLSAPQATELGVPGLNSVLGRLGYIPPEQARGDDVNMEADVFALGAMLTEILTGRRPVAGEQALDTLRLTLEGEIQTPRQLQASVPAELNSLARLCLQAQPNKRLASAQAFVDDLRAFLTGDRVSSHPYDLWSLALWSTRRHPWLLALVASVVLAGTVFLILWGELRQAELLKRQRQQIAAEEVKKSETAAKMAARVQQTLKLLTEAELLAQRGSASADVVALLDQCLDLGGKTQPMYVAAARICERRGLIEGARNYLEMALTVADHPTEILFALHKIETRDDPADSMRWTEPLHRLVLLAQEKDQDDDYTLMAKAIDAWRMEKWREALAYLDKVSQDRRLVWVHYYRGEIYLKLKQWPNALKEFGRALSLDPSSWRSMARRARTLILMERYDEALRDLNRALDLRPDIETLLINRAFCNLTKRNHDAAIRDLVRVVDINPNNYEAFLNLGAAHLRKRQFKEAEAAFSEAIRINRNKVGAYINRAQLHGRQQRYKKALQDYNFALNLEPKNFRAIYNRAICYLTMDRARDALKDFQTALLLQPDFLPASHYMAQTLIRLERHEDALHVIDKVIGRHPRDLKLRLYRAECFQTLGRNPQALREWTEVLSIDPKSVLALRSRGQLRHLKGYRPAAFEDFNRACLLGPKDWQCFLARGMAYLRDQKYSLGLQDLLEARQHKEHKPQAVLPALAQCYQGLKRYQEAIVALNELITIAPNGPALLKRARLALQTAQVDQALADYKSCLELKHKPAVVHKERSELYARLEQWPQALADLGQWLTLEPENPAAWQWQARLQSAQKQWPEAKASLSKALEYAKAAEDSPAAKARIDSIEKDLKAIEAKLTPAPEDSKPETSKPKTSGPGEPKPEDGPDPEKPDPKKPDPEKSDPEKTDPNKTPGSKPAEPKKPENTTPSDTPKEPQPDPKDPANADPANADPANADPANADPGPPKDEPADTPKPKDES